MMYHQKTSQKNTTKEEKSKRKNTSKEFLWRRMAIRLSNHKEKKKKLKRNILYFLILEKK